MHKPGPAPCSDNREFPVTRPAIVLNYAMTPAPDFFWGKSVYVVSCQLLDLEIGTHGLPSWRPSLQQIATTILSSLVPSARLLLVAYPALPAGRQNGEHRRHVNVAERGKFAAM
jgi:hypothetical protein